MTNRAFDFLVFIGRFQPIHNGHAAMLRQALARAPRVVVVLGSAHSARTVRNPFTAAERIALIRSAMGDLAERLVFVEMRDYFNIARWATGVRRAVAAAVPVDASVGLFGHFKDASSGYLRDFPDWPLVEVGNVDGISAADLRKPWFESGGSTAGLEDRLAAPVLQFMTEFAGTEAFSRLRAEYDYLEGYKAAWRQAPYAPIFVTVDAVVTCCDHVLLVQRGGQPGAGCWALPGGFLDQREQVAAASLRELHEETRLAVPVEELQAAVRGQALFDHPDRSSRGRTLTHAFHYALDRTELPAIEADDDAAAAVWVPIAQLLAMEDQFHDDHFMILDRFLGLLPTE
ncbi:MAG: bifunctional nicotinamide-nucleotide adenylyltransferase/Nudix hydroxylase [Burkholderiales bacterium]|nr:bifunctional nicotinamide-nucleotide adenylyltransferase/Nudix hydroxylase [Burkholderiales bacterium]